jgi:DNA-binding transcriptional LysR family regulator
MGTRKVQVGRISDVDIRLLRIFQVVVENGGLAAAEIQLGIGRSTISTHLADIETRLGARLCDRGRGGFALTDHGRKVYQASIALMKSLEEFRSEVNSLHGAVGGDLRVAMVDNVIWDEEFDLVGAFRRFSKVGAEVHLHTYVLSPDEIERKLLDGSLDLGIIPMMHQLASLDYHHLFDEVSYLYCGKGHDLFDIPDDEITSEHLSECSYIRKGYAVTSDFQNTSDQMHHQVTSFHVESIAALILTGAHIGFLPESFASHWVKDGRIRTIRPNDFRACFEFSAVTRKDRSPSSAQSAFIKCLIDAKTLAVPVE